MYFPEGTDKSDNGTRHSNSFANKNNLPRYEYLLHPRVNGFSYVAQKMQHQGKQILDPALDQRGIRYQASIISA